MNPKPMKLKGKCCENGNFEKRHDCLKSNPQQETEKLIKAMNPKPKVVKRKE